MSHREVAHQPPKGGVLLLQCAICVVYATAMWRAARESWPPCS